MIRDARMVPADVKVKRFAWVGFWIGDWGLWIGFSYRRWFVGSLVRWLVGSLVRWRVIKRDRPVIGQDASGRHVAPSMCKNPKT